MTRRACSRLIHLAALASAVGLEIAPAGAEELQMTVGAKAWAAEWSSWTPVGTGTNNITLIQSIASNTHIAYIPQVSARYGQFLATASYLASTDFTLGGDVNPTTPGGLGALTASRKEVDGNLGYYLLPSLAVTVGYKQIEQSFSLQRYTWRGPTLGLSASWPLRDSLAAFATAAYGRLQMNASAPDYAGRSDFKADYILSELGLSYGFDTPLKRLSVAITAGYRIQVVSTREFAVSTGLGGYQPVDLHDITYGPTVSVLSHF